MAFSWVFGANDPALGRGLNHLPFTAFLHPGSGERHLGVGIGACVLDLHAAASFLAPEFEQQLRSPFLNGFLALGPAAHATLRTRLQSHLARENKDRVALEGALFDLRNLTLVLPCDTRDYTDFYASRHHAQRVGELFRPERPLLENYDWVPIGYHGRASSLVPGGTGVRRPAGQVKSAASPQLQPTARLDFELELAFVIGQGSTLGEPIPIQRAAHHLFGVSLLNDWSARDIQAWEYQPLGPFLGKNFCTSVSPWVTPVAALQSNRAALPPRTPGPLPYLQDEEDAHSGAFDLTLHAHLSTARSRREHAGPFHLCTVSAASLGWSPAQMIAHHTVNGCNLAPGDLLGSGTISGEERSSAGCLLELTFNGEQPLQLPNGELRCFLDDGDEVVLSGWASPPGQLPIALGECRGTVLPAMVR